MFAATNPGAHLGLGAIGDDVHRNLGDRQR
jgi:hypothetical protein